MSYCPDTIGFSKKPTMSYLPPNHSLLGKHFKRYYTKNDSKNQKFSISNFKINFNCPKTLKKRKYLLIIVTVFFLALLVIGWATQNRKLKIYQANIAEVLELKQQAELFIQQDQKDLARQKLTLSLNKLNNLSLINKQQKDFYTNLKQSIITHLQEVNQINFIEKPTLFLDFQTILPQADKLNILNISLKGNVMYVVEESQHKIYRLDLKRFLIAESDGPAGNMGNISQILSTPNSLIFVNYQQSLFSYTPGSGFNNIDTTQLSEDLSRAVNIAYFNENLYFLKPRSRQIQKYSFANEQMRDGQDWLQDNKIDLSDATSLTIDGNIYVTKTNGQILKLSNGTFVPFETDIHPILQTDSQIFTSPEHQYLYILEPSLYRLIILDKSGELIIQLNSPEFDNLKSFYPDEKNNILYILNENKIFQVEDYLKANS